MATSYWLPDQGRQVTKESTGVTDNCVANSSYPTKMGAKSNASRGPAKVNRPKSAARGHSDQPRPKTHGR